MFQNKQRALKNRTAEWERRALSSVTIPLGGPTSALTAAFVSPRPLISELSQFFSSFFGLRASEDGFREGFWMLRNRIRPPEVYNCQQDDGL